MSHVIEAEDRAFTLNQAAERLGDISRSHVYNLIRSGKLAAHKIGSRTVIRQASITAYLDSLPVVDPEVDA